MKEILNNIDILNSIATSFMMISIISLLCYIAIHIFEELSGLIIVGTGIIIYSLCGDAIATIITLVVLITLYEKFIADTKEEKE